MSDNEITNRSELLYYASATTGAVAALAEYRDTGSLSPDAQVRLRQCLELMQRILRAQGLVDTRSGRIAADFGSIHAYRYMREALDSLDILAPGESIGEAASNFAATIESVLDGIPLADVDTEEDTAAGIGREDYTRLERAIKALASLYHKRTAESTAASDPANLMQLSEPCLLLAR